MMDTKQLNTFGEFINRSRKIAELCMEVRHGNQAQHYYVDGISDVDENVVCCHVSNYCGGASDFDIFEFPTEYHDLTDKGVAEKEQYRVERENKEREMRKEYMMEEQRKQNERDQYQQYLKLKDKFEHTGSK